MADRELMQRLLDQARGDRDDAFVAYQSAHQSLLEAIDTKDDPGFAKARSSMRECRRETVECHAMVGIIEKWLDGLL